MDVTKPDLKPIEDLWTEHACQYKNLHQFSLGERAKVLARCLAFVEGHPKCVMHYFKNAFLLKQI